MAQSGSIKIILPVCEKDFPLVNLLGQRFIKFADMHERSLLVTACWADHFGISDFCNVLKPCYKDVDLFIMPDVPEDAGWPEAPNHLFYNSMQYLAEHGNKDPVIWLEPDCCPLLPGWLDTYEKEYLEAGLPYAGAINATRFRDRRSGNLNVTGKHCVGGGMILPADFLTRSKAVHFLDHTPFDVAIENEVVPECHETKLIFHAWQTCRYKKIDGQVIGEDVKQPDPAGGIRHFYGGRPVPPETVLVHGCRDDSLYKINFKAKM